MLKSIIIVFTLIACSAEQNKDELLLKKFLTDIVVQEDNDTLLSDYFCTDGIKENSELLNMIVAQMDSLRSKLHKVPKSEISIKEYRDSPVADQNILMNESSQSHVLMVYHKEELLLRVLYTNCKIHSFIIMNKGGKGVFLNFCKS